MTSVRRALACAAAAAMSIAFPVSNVAGAAGPEIYGFTMDAQASAASFLYNQPSFGVPASPTFELNKAHSFATLDSGPSGRALASWMWPGDVAGNASLNLALDVFLFNPFRQAELRDAAQQLLNGVRDGAKRFPPFPPYPVRAESFYPQGPESKKTEMGGGIDMRSKALVDVAEAATTTQRAGFPGAFSVGGMNSYAVSGVVKGRAVSQAISYVTDVNLFGELLIDSVYADMTATSDGTTGTLSGSVRITGMKIHGAPIVVDGKGLHVGSGHADPGGKEARKLIAEHLEPRGVSISVGRSAEGGGVDGAAASREISGLVITLDARGMEAIVKQVPDPVRRWLTSPTSSPLSPLFGVFSPSVGGLATTPFQFDQSMSIVLGRIKVGSAASLPFDFTVGPPAGGVVGPPPTGIDGAAPPAFGGVPPVGAPPGAQPPVTAPPAAGFPGVRLVAALGVPGSLAVLVLLMATLGAVALARLAERSVAAEAAERCDLER